MWVLWTAAGSRQHAAGSRQQQRERRKNNVCMYVIPYMGARTSFVLLPLTFGTAGREWAYSQQWKHRICLASRHSEAARPPSAVSAVSELASTRLLEYYKPLVLLVALLLPGSYCLQNDVCSWEVTWNTISPSEEELVPLHHKGATILKNGTLLKFPLRVDRGESAD
jgi:hypothetical protein